MPVRLFLLVILSLSLSLEGFCRKKRKSQLVSAVENIITAPPQDGEVCFSPDEHCDIKLTKFIESAHTSLDIAIYDINLEQLVHQIILQSKKMPVRVLVDKRQTKERNSLVDLLVKAEVPVRFGHQRGIMHNKFAVVDGKMIETGSFNFTNHATEANSENQIYLSTPAIVGRYQDRFNKIWNDGKPASLKVLASQ
ncbi:MAG: hypothetical protein C5B49_04545 [Bdellovibrio sp.]|nr:MAG: hypothetical protein C5B49_04545 [Bdellovibrio sp.]